MNELQCHENNLLEIQTIKVLFILKKVVKFEKNVLEFLVLYVTGLNELMEAMVVRFVSSLNEK